MNDFLYYKKRRLLRDSLLFRTFAIENEIRYKIRKSLEQELSKTRNKTITLTI